ncbi:MAG: MerR family transcriptional regulator [Bacilli bacterium]|nr:MerR family transcriptional regulator [Bacilli bacterium]
MYTMKDICKELNITYETLKFYCNEGLVPNLKRDKNNHRIFDEDNLNWLRGLLCLRKCGMSIKDMKLYMEYCLQGQSSISQRQNMLENTREELLLRKEEIEECLNYIDKKQKYYNDVIDGKIEYSSYIIKGD